MSTKTQEQGYFPWDSIEPFTPSATDFFNKNGYVIFTNFCSESEISNLRSAAAKIVADFASNKSAAASIFTTTEQREKVNARYFLDSAANVSCFLEEKQIPNTIPAVNKIGHALHDLHPVFQAFSRQNKVRDAAYALGFENPLLVQSMYILKNPRIGGEVRPHRDGTFVLSEDSKRAPTGPCLGYWWALQEATEENACLWAVPGSHRDGICRTFQLNEQKDDTIFVGGDDKVYTEDRYVVLPMNAGDLILLHGALLHMSKENKSAKSRHAYSIHVIEGNVPSTCWLQRPASLPFRIL